MASPFTLHPETRGRIVSASPAPPSFGRASLSLAANNTKPISQPGNVTAMPALKVQDCSDTGGAVADARVKKEWAGLYWDREIVGSVYQIGHVPTQSLTTPAVAFCPSRQ